MNVSFANQQTAIFNYPLTKKACLLVERCENKQYAEVTQRLIILKTTLIPISFCMNQYITF